MKILWLNTGVLLPLDKGGKLRTWHLMRHLARRHAITYLSFTDPDAAPEHRAAMAAVCRRLETVPRREPPKRSARFYLDAAKYLFHPLPYAVAKYESRPFRQRLETLLRTSAFDVLVCDFLFPAVNLPPRLPCPSLIFTHNVESEIWRRHAENRHGLAKRLFTEQCRRMLTYECSVLEAFDRVVAVSDADARTLSTLCGSRLKAPVHVVPTGVDTAYFAPAKSIVDRRHLIFTGSMDWLPNEDAMIYFCREILPRVREHEPAVTLRIVGRAPTPAVLRLAQQDGIEVTGRVDDVRPHVARAGVYVVPLRIGGGTRLKIFEAMAMGKAVVSTTIGAEGLPVTDGGNIALADDVDGFARAVVELIRNPERRRALEASARRLVVERYDWSAVAGSLEQALAELADGVREADLAPPRAAAG
jgi:polysaccharide biosynthesis protein PslH